MRLTRPLQRLSNIMRDYKPEAGFVKLPVVAGCCRLLLVVEKSSMPFFI
jgi:hypothetical protein